MLVPKRKVALFGEVAETLGSGVYLVGVSHKGWVLKVLWVPVLLSAS